MCPTSGNQTGQKPATLLSLFSIRNPRRPSQSTFPYPLPRTHHLPQRLQLLSFIQIFQTFTVRLSILPLHPTIVVHINSPSQSRWRLQIVATAIVQPVLLTQLPSPTKTHQNSQTPISNPNTRLECGRARASRRFPPPHIHPPTHALSTSTPTTQPTV